MALRQATLLIRDRQVSGGALPANALMGEPFVNLYDGILKFSGVTGGSFEPSDSPSIFEVGSVLYNSKITNRLNINNNFIISGGTGIISTYGGQSGSGLNGKFLSGTTSGFVLGNISDIQGVTDITRVQPGSNITTGGTGNLPIVSLVASPSVNNITFSGTAIGGNVQAAAVTATSLSATTLSGGTILSGGTNLYNIFLTAGDLSGTTVSAGSNTSVQQTGNDYKVSVVASPSFNNITFSGTAIGGNVQAAAVTAISLSATTLSGGTILSGGTDLYSIFQKIGDDTAHTYVQPGTNITTGGTASAPIINLTASPSVNNLTFSGTAIGGNVQAASVTATSLSATTLSGGTILSGSTNLYSIFAPFGTISGVETIGQGSNILTGGTAVNPTISLVASPSIDGLTASGTSNFTGTLQSGGTNLYNIFVNSVNAGTNVSIGGTAGSPIVNVVSSPVFTGLVSATGFTDSSLTAGRVVYAGVGGLLKDEAGFTYDESSDTLNAQHIIVGAPGQTGTTATIYGDVLVVGQSISGFTSQLYIEDNTIELNFNPTASTETTSLGAGWSIKDGSGSAGTDVLFDIRGTSTGLANRSFATNLFDIRIRETGTISAPNGVRVIAEFDVIDGGNY